MRKSVIGASRRSVPVVRVLAALGALLWAQPSSAALQVGPPFTLADAEITKFQHSIAGNERGFVLSWSRTTSLFAQKVGADGSLSGPPLLLAGAVPTGVPPPLTPGPKEWTEVGPPVVSANHRQFLVQFDEVRAGLLGPNPSPLYMPPKLEHRLLDDDGVHESPFNVISSGSYAEVEYGVTSKAGNGFVLLLGLVKLNVVPADLALLRSGGAPTVKLPPAETGGGLPWSPLVGVASDGESALVAHLTGPNLPPTFLRVTADGTITKLTLPGVSSRMGSMQLASFASTHLIVWQDAGGALSALRVDANGEALDKAPIVLGGSTTSRESLGDVEPGPDSWLVLSGVTAEGGRHLRMRRLSFDGTVLDPEGVDLELGVPGDLAYASGDRWLLTTHEDVDGTERILGRFVGEGALPEPPNNVPQPPERPGSAAGPSSSSTGGAASVPSTGGARNAGGANGASDAGSTGGKHHGADAGDANTPASDGGCGCKVAAPNRVNALRASAIALAVSAVRFLRRRRVERAGRPRRR